MAVSSSYLGLNCRACTESQKEERGCEKDSTIPDRWKIRDWSFNRCPIKVADSNTGNLMFAYELYKAGFLPNGDRWVKESYKFLKAMQIIDGVIHEIQREQSEKMRG